MSVLYPPSVSAKPAVNNKFPTGRNEVLIDSSIIHAYYVNTLPTNAISEGWDFLEFDIKSAGPELIDLSQIFVSSEVSIRKKDGKVITATDHVVPVNGLANALWSSVEVWANGTLIREKDENYGLISYIQTTLGLPQDVKSTIGAAMGFNEAQHLDKIELLRDQSAKPEEENLTTEQRSWKDRFAGGKSVFFCTQLVLDLTSLSHFLPPGVNLRLKFTRQKDRYFLITPAPEKEFTLKLLSCSLYVKKLVPSHNAHLALEKVISQHHLTYSYKRITSKTWTIQQGEASKIVESPFGASIPHLLLLCCLPQASHHGTYDTNPFLLTPNKMSRTRLTIDGNTVADWNLNYARNQYSEAYLFSMLNYGIDQLQHGLTYDDFKTHKNILVFDLSPDDAASSTGYAGVLDRQGLLRLELQFSEATTTTLTLVLIAVSQAGLTITKDRSVIPSVNIA